MDLEHKTFAIKALSAEGDFHAVISTDAVDRDGEIVAREAWAGSLGKTIPLIQSHDWGSRPIGRGVVGQNAEGTTLAGHFFLDTLDGAEAYKTAKNLADLQEFSVGFMPVKADMVLVDGKNVRKITDLELFEASLVLVGASRGTRLTAIKGADPDLDEFTVESALEYVAKSPDMADADMDQLHAAMAAMQKVHDDICDQGEDCPMGKAKAGPPQRKASEEEERKKAMRELESMLGYRPLIALAEE